MTPAPVIEHAEPAPPIENIAPAPPAPNSLPNQSLPPAYTMDTTDVATPQCSTGELQIGDLGFDMFGKSREVIRIGVGPHFLGQIRVLYPEQKRGRFESGSWM